MTVKDGHGESFSDGCFRQLRNARVTRVVVDEGGLALSLEEAQEKFPGIVPSHVFIREDGWKLAAPAELQDTAYSLWPDEWSYYFNILSGKSVTIETYLKIRAERKKKENVPWT